jgi:hypothetical protein
MAGPLTRSSTGPAKKEQELVLAKRTKEFDGPLKALEEFEEGAEILTYPQDLGNNNQFKYVMRLLIFRQIRDVNAVPIITPNSLDFSRKASQEGRLETDIINPTTATAVLAGAAGAVVGRVVEEFASKGSRASGALNAIGDAAVSAAQLTGAYAVATAFDSGFSGSQNVVTDPLSYINLYMPDGLNFVDRHDYDAVSVTDALGNLGVLGTGSVTEIGARLGENARIAGVSLLGQNITDLALYNSGYALNPQLQVLFKGSKNREFVFTFKFVPRNAYEAETIESIIRTLRYHAAPNYQRSGEDGLAGTFFGVGVGATDNSRYFIPPSQFEIEFLVMTNGAAIPNTKMPRIAQCVLTNIDVNYAPSGQFSAYEDFQPVETQVQLTFTETIILTKEDIEAGY